MDREVFLEGTDFSLSHYSVDLLATDVLILFWWFYPILLKTILSIFQSSQIVWWISLKRPFACLHISFRLFQRNPLVAVNSSYSRANSFIYYSTMVGSRSDMMYSLPLVIQTLSLKWPSVILRMLRFCQVWHETRVDEVLWRVEGSSAGCYLKDRVEECMSFL